MEIWFHDHAELFIFSHERCFLMKCFIFSQKDIFSRNDLCCFMKSAQVIFNSYIILFMKGMRYYSPLLELLYFIFYIFILACYS
jgi:hypothetical protein